MDGLQEGVRGHLGADQLDVVADQQPERLGQPDGQVQPLGRHGVPVAEVVREHLARPDHAHGCRRRHALTVAPEAAAVDPTGRALARLSGRTTRPRHARVAPTGERRAGCGRCDGAGWPGRGVAVARVRRPFRTAVPRPARARGVRPGDRRWSPLGLSAPWATATGQRAPFVDALFTAASASTVTGLVVGPHRRVLVGLGPGRHPRRHPDRRPRRDDAGVAARHGRVPPHRPDAAAARRRRRPRRRGSARSGR